MITKHFIQLTVSCILLISCRSPRYIYSPAPPNNPYFREKEESKLAAFYSTGGDASELTSEYNNGFDLQAAYAITDHFAITGDYFKRNEKDAIYDFDRSYFDSSIVRYHRHLTNFGGGYYTDLLNDKHVYLNLFGGIGFGKLSFTDNGIENGNNYTRVYNSNMTKWYIQPSLNIFTGNYFRIGFVGKISWVHFHDISTTYSPAELDFLELDLLPGRTLSFFEATMGMQVSFKKMNWLFIEGSMTGSSDPFENETINLEARNFNASIGLGIDLSKFKNQNK